MLCIEKVSYPAVAWRNAAGIAMITMNISIKNESSARISTYFWIIRERERAASYFSRAAAASQS